MGETVARIAPRLLPLRGPFIDPNGDSNETKQ
jgi:hypothetical protein